MMSEENKAIVKHSPDQRDVATTATNPAQMPHLQQELLEWARNRVVIARKEAEEASEAYEVAASSQFDAKPLQRFVDRAAKDVLYYEKLLAALEAGYVLVPSMPCEVFAVRTKAQGPYGSKLYAWQSNVPDVPAQALARGEGRYVDPAQLVAQTQVEEPETRFEGGKDVLTGNMKQVTRFYASALDPEIRFPLVMAKPEIMRASRKAISLKLFDELGIVQDQQQAHGDPIIIGRIIKPTPGVPLRRARRVSFFVAWYVDTKAL